MKQAGLADNYTSIRKAATQIPFMGALTSEGLVRLGLDSLTPIPEYVTESTIREKVWGPVYGESLQLDAGIVQCLSPLLKPIVDKDLDKALALRNLLLRLVTKCSGAGVPVVFLKGIALSELVYMSTGYRRMGDIDFLIHAADLETVCQFMRELGMEQAREGRHNHHLAWYLEDGTRRLNIECHWNIVPSHGPFPVKAEELWNDATHGDFAGLPVSQLSPADALLHTCIHSHFHGYRRLLCDYFDVYTLVVHREPLDWQQLAARAHRWNANSVLYVILTEMVRFFRVDDTIQGQIARLQPNQYLQRKLILPLLSRKARGKPQGMNQAYPMVTQSGEREVHLQRPSDVENLVLSICGGRISELTIWLLPPPGRLRILYDLQPEESCAAYYVRYYIDVVRRLCGAVLSFVRGMGRS